jgi:hypothetical protein
VFLKEISGYSGKPQQGMLQNAAGMQRSGAAVSEMKPEKKLGLLRGKSASGIE